MRIIDLIVKLFIFDGIYSCFMNQLIEKLLEGVETGSPEWKISHLVDIGDHIDFAYPKDEDLRAIVQRLVNISVKETDEKIQGTTFRIISKAYMQRVDLTEISFEPLIAILDKAGPGFICSVIYLLSMTYQNKYIPVISEYSTHPDKKVRQEAESAIEYLTRQ
jgi:hypothetical protein